jgi:hypothetical protein
MKVNSNDAADAYQVKLRQNSHSIYLENFSIDVFTVVSLEYQQIHFIKEFLNGEREEQSFGQMV